MKKLSLYLFLFLSCFLLFGCGKAEDKNTNNNTTEEENDIDIISTDDTIVFKSTDNIYTTFYYDGEALEKVTMTSVFDTEEEAEAAVELFEGADFKDMYGNIKRTGTKVTLDYVKEYFNYYTNLTKTEMETFMGEAGYEVVE